MEVELEFETENGLLQDKYARYQNQPNPFKSETNIGSYLPEASHAMLTI